LFTELRRFGFAKLSRFRTFCPSQSWPKAVAAELGPMAFWFPAPLMARN
jgi:hypothetical protein